MGVVAQAVVVLGIVEEVRHCEMGGLVDGGEDSGDFIIQITRNNPVLHYCDYHLSHLVMRLQKKAPGGIVPSSGVP